MKVFVTGGAGFIASHLCERLLSEGHEVVAFDNLHLGRKELLDQCLGQKSFRFIEADLLNLDAVMDAIEGSDLVFHLAANSDISAGTESTDVDLRIGTLATYNVLEGMRRRGVKQIVFASTSAIYGEATIKPTAENYGPLFPISFYGASKLACEGLMKAFSHNFDISVWIFRFANIVGSHATHGILFDLCQRLLRGDKELRILGDGTQKKSYLHVSDCVEGMLFGYENSKSLFQCFNLASRGVSSVRFIVEEFARLGKIEMPIQYGKEDRGWKSDVPYTWLADTLMKELGWAPRLTSQEAVTQACEEILKENHLWPVK